MDETGLNETFRRWDGDSRSDQIDRTRNGASTRRMDVAEKSQFTRFRGSVSQSEISDVC